MMRRTVSIILLLAVVLTSAFAQDQKFFRSKLGENPVELYRHKSGVEITVKYDSQGQACVVSIRDPSHRRGEFNTLQRWKVVANELMPMLNLGRLLNQTGNIGNCTDERYFDYERALVFENQNACYDQWIQILFKRGTCPKPPSIPGLTPTTK